MTDLHWTHAALALLAAVALLAGSPDSALAIDGSGISGMAAESPETETASATSAEPIEAPAGTYYEATIGDLSAEQRESVDPGLPNALHFSDSTARVEYALDPVSDDDDDDAASWTVRIRDLQRNHERIDDVYQMVLVLPLPEGRRAFRPLHWGITVREGTEAASVPFIYSGEKVVLKRNRSLEKQLLPAITGPGYDQLPALDGTGYAYTLWDAIIRYDAQYGDTVQAFAQLRYTTDVDVPAPDPTDERLKAYVLTWLPALDPTIPPFAVRMDIQ